MKISILTLFPEMFEGPFRYSIVKKALDKKLVAI
ncbi:MAG: tRNA (guanosine(37)-N1)-methyltransferase TrmD, partial [bacterium]|nr:tRNA (guanosine(37)-N1)-methyltransferase TrmD [bacterium]